jgi:integrase
MTALAFPAPADPTVRQLIDAYLDAELPELAVKSQKQRRRHLEAFAAKFGNYPWATPHKSDVKTWVRNNSAWRANDTKRSVVVSVKRLFSWAVEDDRIGRNPLAKLSWEESPPRRAMTDAEYVRALFAAPWNVRRVLRFLRYSGARPGEAAALDWSMVDWEMAVARIENHKTRRKTGRPKLIYLTPRVLRMLRRLHQHRRPEANWVFHNRYGGRWDVSDLANAMQRIRGRAGLPDDCFLYGLRHQFATMSQVAGNDLKTTAELLGHSSVRTTEKYYVHLAAHTRFLTDAAAKAGHKERGRGRG